MIPHSANVASTCPLDLTLWHRRCSHLNFADLKHMHDKNLVTGMDLRSKTPPDPICESCIFGKQRRHNIPKTATRRTSTLALVHTDLKGPLPVQSAEGHRYWEPFVDDKSRYIAVSFLKKKSEALQAFKQYKAYAENKLGCKIQMQRDDKGGEFISREFEDFCANEGILRQHTEPGEPHQNGVAERSTKRLLLVQPHFLFRPSSPLLSGHLQLQPMCTRRTGPPPQLSMEKHPISIGKARNQTSLISECLDVLPMFWFANLKGKHLNPTLGNAYSLGILRG